MNTSLDNLQQATEGHLNEQREVIFRKLNNLKGDLETHIEAIEQVQDSHTISIEDMEVRGTIDAMVRTLEKPEMYGLKTSASILMDEMNKIKKSFPSVQEQVEVIIANFKELSEQAQTLSEGLATERLLNKASEENLYKSIEKIGRAHDKLEAIIGNMEPDRVDVTPRVMNIENQLGFIYKTLKQYEKDSENLNGLAQKIEHLKMNNDERSAEVLNIMSNQAQLLTEIGNLQSSLASDSSPNSSNSGKLREEISRRMIQLQESFSSALSRALNK
jgi:chromosome segregation ATPase